MPRTYTLKDRARSQEDTRRRIVEAAIELHQAQGVGATSMQDIARKAGVGKVTVYRHFPTDEDVLTACSGAYFERHPLPDPAEWRVIRGPAERLSHGLRTLYAFHRETAPMMQSVLPELRAHPLGRAYGDWLDSVVSVLLEAWPGALRGDPQLGAALSLMVRFETWQHLAIACGLCDDEAVALVSRLVPTDTGAP